MLLSHLVGVLRRRWLAALVGLLATIGVCAVTPKFVPTEYSISATMLLLPPVNTAVPGANPYLALGGLTGPTEVLARAMTDPAMDTRLRTSGATGTWEIVRDYQTSAPILAVTVTDTSVARARNTSELILTQVPAALKELQSSIQVQADAMITSTVVNRNSDPQTVRKPLYRALIVVLLIGLLLTVALASVIDVMAQRRRRARAAARAADSVDVPIPPVPDRARLGTTVPSPSATYPRAPSAEPASLASPTSPKSPPASTTASPPPKESSQPASRADLARSGRGTPGG